MMLPSLPSSPTLVSRSYLLTSSGDAGATRGGVKGYGFVQFENQEKQKEALEKLHEKEVDGRVIKVKVAINHVDENGNVKLASGEEPTVVA